MNIKMLRILMIAAGLAIFTAACGGSQPSADEPVPAPADATVDCSQTSGKCKLVVSDNYDVPIDFSVAVDVAYKGSEVQMDEDHINPIGQTWTNFFYMKKEVAYYHLEPGESLPFVWTGNAGLYRVTVHSEGYADDTVAYAYTGFTPVVSDSSYYRVSCNPSTISVTTSTKTYTGWGVAIYINDNRWAVIVDVANQTARMELPKPEFKVDPSRINIDSNKWDNFIEVDRDNHLDHKNAAFCSYQYQTVVPATVIPESDNSEQTTPD